MILPSRVIKNRSIVLPSNIGRSILIISLSTTRCFPTIAVIPRISSILAKFYPTTLPITISEELENTEAIDVATSGREVPKAIMVTPIIKGGILK